MRILVVEDDAKIASFVVKGLKEQGYAVDHAPDGDTGLTLAGTTAYDAAIIDVMLPGLDGLSLVKRMRAANAVLPVLFLSARASVEDRVKGLQAGGDDYLTKPFAFAELSARLQALIRRASRAPEATRLTARDVTLDLVARTVTVGGRLRYFGDGWQIAKRLEGRRFWRVPVMDGEFTCEEAFGTVKGVAGGNIIILGADPAGALRAAEIAASAMRTADGVVLPFPGGIARSG